MVFVFGLAVGVAVVVVIFVVSVATDVVKGTVLMTIE